MSSLFDSKELLDAVEKSNNCKLMHRSDIAFLLDEARTKGAERAFEDILFHAKFISHAQIILKREGTGTEQTKKLSVEFQQAIETISAMITTMIQGSSSPQRAQFQSRFLSLTPESLTQFFSLLQDLTMIKNYLLDRERTAQ